VHRKIIVFFFACSLIHFLYGGPATITGNKMNILQKGDILEFIGNVKLVQQNINITADRMKSNEKTGMVHGAGNIAIRYSSGTEDTYTWGDTADYNKNTGSGIITGNVKVKRTLSKSTTDVVNLTCDKLELFEFGDRFHAIGNVKVNQPFMVATSSEAFYDHKSKEIMLIGGSPKIVKSDSKGNSEYSGDRIIIVTDREVFTVLGNTKTKIGTNRVEVIQTSSTVNKAYGNQN